MHLKPWKDWRLTLPLSSIIKTFCLFPLTHRDIYVSYEFMELSWGYFKTNMHLKLNLPWAQNAGDAIWTCFNTDLWSLPLTELIGAFILPFPRLCLGFVTFFRCIWQIIRWWCVLARVFQTILLSDAHTDRIMSLTHRCSHISKLCCTLGLLIAQSAEL